MATKPTKRDMFVEAATILADAGREDLAGAMTHEVELIDKRKSAPRKPTAGQVENEALKSAIVEVLSNTGAVSATDVANTMDMSVQKASQLLRQLVAAGAVTRTEGKGKTRTTFAVA